MSWSRQVANPTPSTTITIVNKSSGAYPKAVVQMPSAQLKRGAHEHAISIDLQKNGENEQFTLVAYAGRVLSRLTEDHKSNLPLNPPTREFRGGSNDRITLRRPGRQPNAKFELYARISFAIPQKPTSIEPSISFP